MAREKKPVHKVQMTDGKRNIIQRLLQEYDIQSGEDIQDALRDLLGGTIKEMMDAEMDEHLGYEKSERYHFKYLSMLISLHLLIPNQILITIIIHCQLFFVKKKRLQSAISS